MAKLAQSTIKYLIEATFDAEGVVDQSRLLVVLHDLATGVEAAAAVDAFNLQPLADVDLHRAGGDAGGAFDAAVLFTCRHLQSQGSFIDQRRLNATVGAELLAHQAADQGQVEVDGQSQAEQCQ